MDLDLPIQANGLPIPIGDEESFLVSRGSVLVQFIGQSS